MAPNRARASSWRPPLQLIEQVEYSKIKEIRSAARAFGLWGDVVVFLKDGSRLELAGLEKFDEASGSAWGWLLLECDCDCCLGLAAAALCGAAACAAMLLLLVLNAAAVPCCPMLTILFLVPSLASTADCQVHAGAPDALTP